MIPGARSAPHVALCERGQALSSSEAVLRRCTLIGGAVPTLSKPTADRSLCGSGPDALAERRGRSRAGSVQSRQPATANNIDSLAWLWLRNQPRSALSVWFHERVSRNGGRLRKTTIVALARKLLVALWKYVTAGVVIEGVTMKA